MSEPAYTSVIPSDEIGLRRIVNSSEFQLHREAAICEVPLGPPREHYVRTRLVIRRRQEDDRAKKRENAVDRRQMIQAGEVDPLSYLTVAGLHGAEKRGPHQDPMIRSGS